MMDKEAALQRYVDGMGASHNPQCIREAKRFLKFVRSFDRESVLAFIKHLQDEGYAPGTVDKFVRTARLVVKRNEEKWPLLPGEGPRIPANEERALALSIPTVKRMVQAAKSGQLDIRETWILALSTIYGLRSSEMAPTSRFIDLNNRTLYVQTKKGGQARYHYIPDEILPIAEQVLPHVNRISPRYVKDSFREIEAKCGIEHIMETGLHSIRRSLNYYLIDSSCPTISVTKFMRWKTGRDKQDMTIRYTEVRFVGVDIARDTDTGNEKEEDQKIFDIHPFLPMWR